MSNQILFGKEARQKLYDGVKKIADAVVTTLGPNGRNCVIMRSYQTNQGLHFVLPHVTKDGYTVAKSVTLPDQQENTGALIIKNAAQKTVEQAGDGTTTTCLFTNAIVERGLEFVDKGANPMELKKGIDAAVVAVVAELKAMAIPVGNNIEKIRQVATVSANNDSSIGDLIADAFKRIGVDGVINIEEAKGVKTEIKMTDGITFGRGWVSPYFITNHAKNVCEMEAPYILLYDKKLSQFKLIEKILGEVMQDGKPLLIICDDADGDALAALASNAAAKRIACCIVRAPEFGDKKREAMEDLAILTGGTYVSDEKGKGLVSLKLADLGKAAKVIVGKEETTIISGNTKKDQLQELMDSIRMDLTKAGEEDKVEMEARLAKLQGGVAVLYVGGPTELEMKERKDRCDDAIKATKSAIAEGFVPGGGTAFLRTFANVNRAGKSFDFINGVDIIISVLTKPLEQICKNAGVEYAPILEQLEGKGNVGYNARAEKIEDMVAAGIIDPTKVLRCSLENAASAAGMIITSETLIWGNGTV